MSSGGSGDVVRLPRQEGETTVYPDSEPPPPEPSENDHPARVGRYVVLEMLGMGGMGVVCTAYDPKLDRKVAVKLLRNPGRPGTQKAKTGRARLVREAQALAKLSHPNIVTVHDVDTTPQGRLYMAMEYVDGRTLSQWVLSERPAWREVLAVFDAAGQGLAAAHAAGIIHRDFKPANVLIGEDGRARVLDFGLAKTDADDISDHAEDSDLDGENIMDVVSSASDVKLTKAGRIVGTPAYMAPEQRGGLSVGPESDQFGFAVALFEALYGVLPFRAHDHYADAAEGIMVEPPKEAEVPAWVLRVLKRALHPNPRKRYPKMNDMLAALRADPARRRRRALAALGGAALGGLAIYGAAAAVGTPDQRCAGAQTRLEDSWGADDKAGVSDALRGTGTAFAEYTAKRVEGGLDQYAASWTEARVKVCEATRVYGDQSEALLDVRMGCLDRRRGEMDALLGVLRDADGKVVQRAVTAVASLRDPAGCTAAQPGGENALPEDADARAKVLALRKQLDQAGALIAAGRYKKAEPVVTAALDSSVDHPLTMAKANFTAGRVKRFLGRHKDAQAHFEAAGLLAAEADDPRTEAAAWTKLVYLVGVRMQEPERGLTWATAARAALQRAGEPPALVVDLESDIAAVLMSANRLGEALEHQEHALTLARETFAADGPGLANALRNVGVTLFRVGKAREGEERLRESLRVAEESLGPEHPDVASSAQNLGNALAERSGAREEAAGLLERALRINRETFGGNHPRTAALEVALGRLDKAAAKWDEAEARFNRALKIYESAGDARRVAQTLNNVGGLQLDQKRFAEAHRAFSDARARLIDVVGEGDLLVARSDHNLCQVALAQDRHEEARLACARALPVMTKTFVKPHRTIVRLRLDLARALKGLGETSAAAEQVGAARALLAQLPDPPAALVELAASF